MSTSKSGQELHAKMDEIPKTTTPLDLPATTEPQPENEQEIDLEAIALNAPPTPAIIKAGEAAMRKVGLLDATIPSLPLAPWWTTSPLHYPRDLGMLSTEYYANGAYEAFSRAQRYNRKAERFRNQKLEVLYEMLFRRDAIGDPSKSDESKSKSNKETDKKSVYVYIDPMLGTPYTMKPPALPWNNLTEWEDRDWLAIHGDEWIWENREEKRKYREGCKKMRKYKRKALVEMTRTYVLALKAVRAKSYRRVWGEQFG